MKQQQQKNPKGNRKESVITKKEQIRQRNGNFWT